MVSSNSMKFILILFATVSLASPTNYQKLERLRKEISSGQAKYEKEYISVFPSSFKSFQNTFAYVPKKTNLASVYDNHLSLLEGLLLKFPEKVLALMLNIAVDGSWDADAVSRLQHTIVSYASKNTEKFVKVLLNKSDTKQKSIIKFLADVEYHPVFRDYKILQKNLKKLGLNKVSEQFDHAKSQRMLIKH